MTGFTVAAAYRSARTGGDFFDYTISPSGRLLFLMLDIAGKREEALTIAAAAQDRFQAGAAERFPTDEVNESTALTEVALDLNRAIMQAASGVRCSPAFLACCDPSFGTVWYVNAGHTPALLRSGGEIVQLDSNGLPLGLFSHATHDAQISVLPPGGALLLVSRGIVEARAAQEFGMPRVQQAMAANPTAPADQLCEAVLAATDAFMKSALSASAKLRLHLRGDANSNDRTALALVRN